MALINCPECGKEISDKAKQCIHCGFPLEDYVQEFNIYDMVLKKIIKKTSFAVCILENYYGIAKGEGDALISTPGNVILKGINKENIEYLKYEFSREGLEMDFIPSDSDYVNPVNSRISGCSEEWKAKQKSAIKCPTCGSTNTQKISTTSKVVGAAAFGLFSKTARSQFKCNHCGYKW